MRAVVYALSRPDEQECLAFCLAEGWEVVALVRDDRRGRRWTDAWAVLASADRLVVASEDRLPPQRRPQIVAVDQQRGTPSRRRAPLLRRPQVRDQ